LFVDEVVNHLKSHTFDVSNSNRVNTISKTTSVLLVDLDLTHKYNSSSWKNISSL